MSLGEYEVGVGASLRILTEQSLNDHPYQARAPGRELAILIAGTGTGR